MRSFAIKESNSPIPAHYATLRHFNVDNMRNHALASKMLLQRNVLICLLYCANRSQDCSIVQISGLSKLSLMVISVAGVSSPISTFLLPGTVSGNVMSHVQMMTIVPLATFQKVRIQFSVYCCFVITLDYRGSQSYNGSKPYPRPIR